MRPVVPQGHGEIPTIRHTNEPLGARLFQRTLVAQPCSHKPLNFYARVIFQRLECLVGLGKRIGFLASGQTNLSWRLHTEPAQHICELVVAHQQLLDTGSTLREHLVREVRVAIGKHHVPHGIEQVGLDLFDLTQVRLQHRLVKPQHRVDEHTQGEVDQLQLDARESHTHVGLE